MAITNYHPLVGRQGRVGLGYQGLRYDRPVSMAVARDPVEADVEDASVDVQPGLPVNGEGVSDMAGLPASADPVSSGDPSSLGFGGTEEGDRGQTPMEAAVNAFTHSAVPSMQNNIGKTVAMSILGIPSTVTPLSMALSMAKSLPKAWRAYRMHMPQTQEAATTGIDPASMSDLGMSVDTNDISNLGMSVDTNDISNLGMSVGTPDVEGLSGDADSGVAGTGNSVGVSPSSPDPSNQGGGAGSGGSGGNAGGTGEGGGVGEGEGPW